MMRRYLMGLVAIALVAGISHAGTLGFLKNLRQRPQDNNQQTQQAAEKSAPAQSEAPASSGAVNGINAINQGIRQTFNRMSRPLSRPAANTN